MGRKPARKRKHFFVCLAQVIFLAGCSLWTENLERHEAREYSRHAQLLMAQGDYEGVIKESKKTLSASRNQPPADAAIFHMGLVYVHPGNPKKDYRRAMGLFNRVIKEFPESPLAEQAKIWVGVLDVVEKSKQVDIEIEEKKRDKLR